MATRRTISRHTAYFESASENKEISEANLSIPVVISTRVVITITIIGPKGGSKGEEIGQVNDQVIADGIAVTLPGPVPAIRPRMGEQDK